MQLIVTLALLLAAPRAAASEEPPWGYALEPRPHAFYQAVPHAELDLERQDVTIEVWLRLDEDFPAQQGPFPPPRCTWILSKYDDDFSYRLGIVRVTHYPRDLFYGCFGSQWTILGSLTTEEWRKLTWTIDFLGYTSGTYLYREQIGLNGTWVLTSESRHTTPMLPNTDNPLIVGQDFYGSIEELRISDTVRTYQIPPFTCDANTRALWHFDESEPTVFHDECGTNNQLLATYNHYLPMIGKFLPN